MYTTCCVLPVARRLLYMQMYIYFQMHVMLVAYCCLPHATGTDAPRNDFSPRDARQQRDRKAPVLPSLAGRRPGGKALAIVTAIAVVTHIDNCI